MGRLTKILARDGRQVLYDPARVVASILDAIRAAGHPDESLADKLAPMVEFGLTRYYGALPTLDDVAHCIEQSLRSVTESPAIADAYLARRRQRQRLREVSLTPGDHSAGGPSVAGVSADTLGEWNRSRIEAALVRERDLPLDEAKAIGRSVEQRILKAGLSHLSTALIRAMVDAELVERGLLTPDSAPSAYVIPAFDVQQSLFPQAANPALGVSESARTLESRVAGALLQQYSLSAMHTPDVARAHLSGKIDLGALHLPARACGASLHCVRILSKGAGLGFDAEYPEPCQGAPELTSRLSRFAWLLAGMSAGPVTLHRMDTAVSGHIGHHAPDLLPLLLDRLAAVGAAHAGETGDSDQPGIWLVFDALAGEVQSPGSLPVLRGAIEWLRDSAGNAGRALGIRIRIGAASMDDRAAASLLEQSVSLAMGGGFVEWEFVRDGGAEVAGLFGEPADPIPVVSCIPAAGVLNLLAPFPATLSPDIAVPEDRVYAALEENSALLVRALAQRTEFLRRFAQRRLEGEGGMAARLAAAVYRNTLPCRAMVSGLGAASAVLAASDSPDDASRMAQRLLSWLHFRLRDAAKRQGAPCVLSGQCSPRTARRFARLGTGSTPAEPGEPGAGRNATGFAFRTPADRGLEWRLGEESALHSLAPDAIASIDPASERLSHAQVVRLLSAAIGEPPLSSVRLSVQLKRCAACGASNPVDAKSCTTCGTSAFRAMPMEPRLFELPAQE